MNQDTKRLPERASVLVVGAGPAGSMTATLLAREGVDVVLVEKEKSPRYHIGESLLMSVRPLLQFAGVDEKVRAHGFTRKPGAIFKIKHDAPPGYLDFSRSKYRHSYQVIRSEFDHLLLEHARESGALAVDECAVTRVVFDDERPVAAEYRSRDGGAGSIAFDTLVDASGLDGLMATRYLKNRAFQESFMNVALVRYWRGTTRITGEREGAILVESLSDGSGWSWIIPLHDGSDSVGVVIHRDKYAELRKQAKDPQEVYHDRLMRAPDSSRLLAGGTPVTEMKIWQDYSYCAAQFAGPGFRLVGDAAGFIDPFFSTGVHLAFLSAFSAAATIRSWLRKDFDEATLVAYHDKLVRRAYLRFLLAVSGFYAQIRDQREVKLPGVTMESFQLAFDALQPLVAGHIDANKRELTPAAVERTMKYLGETIAEIHGIDTGSKVSRYISARLQDQDFDFGDMNPEEAIDGLYIHLVRGDLGVRKIGMMVKAANRMRRAAIKIGLKTAVAMDHALG